ncbi:ubiquitin-2 like Rad60 SUMO-like-domain-containing protein [Morchella snyderi]|nr:ubiquitin-2 like Rad60 SUMO-like-domain-containing protein [Morchella snyderi]
MSLSPSPPSPPRPPRRQFLFKRANLSAPDSTSGAPGTDTAVPDFFSRREQNYTAPEAVAKKVKPKRPKKKVAADGSPPKRARGDDSAEEGGAAHDRRGGAKQRCDAIVLSGSEDDGGSNAARKLRTKTKPKPRKREVSLTPPPTLYNDPISYTSSAPTQRPTTTTTTAASTQPISLDSDPEDPAPISAEDALFATLEKRAREKAAAAAAAVPTTTSPLSPPLPDPIISILITSRIEETQPLVLRIRANQTLKAARTTWCQRQGFTADQAADIFLTWKGNKVFDHNSCRGVGIRPVGGEENIHLEAVTVEGYAAMERERERRYALAGGEVEDEIEEEVVEKEEVVMRLTLRRKGAEDFKIKVRPETKISKLIAAYRIANKVPEEKEIRLDFDGDDLNPEETVDDTELEDLFGIDVYVS